MTNRNDVLQKIEGLVNGRISVKAGARLKLVVQDSFKALGQAVCLLLQLGLLLIHCQSILLQLLIMPAQSTHEYMQSLHQAVLAECPGNACTTVMYCCNRGLRQAVSAACNG